MTLISWRLAALLTLGTALLAISPIASIIALIACALAALVGPSYALQALTIATLIAYGNPAIFKSGPTSAILVRLVLLAAVVRALCMLRGSDLRLLWPIGLFGVLSALTSLLRSPAVTISIMKVITFTLASSAVLIAFLRLPAARLPRIQTWFLTVGFTVIGLSALTLAKPGFGIGANGGLQGILNQPQALGIFIAPFAAWSISGVLLMRRRASHLELWVAIGAVVLIILTRARTAAVATTVAVLIVTLSRALSRRRAQQASLLRPVLVIGVATLGVGIAALATGKVGAFLTEFAFKGTQQENRNLGNAFNESRGAGVLSQWRHFEDSPVIGNGFGVYPDGKFPSGVVEFAGIPISAPIEKGFLPTAILEEGGLIGAAALALVIMWLARTAWRGSDLRWRAMFVACLGINVGECVFLAPGGIGILDWLVMGLTLMAYRASLPQARPEAAAVQRPQQAPATALRHAPPGAAA
ncbi:MAG TPA: hypothetical protein VMT66_03585 [Steroidobacteraceae bacterium]|nr:hypothetical protein [Steroidobacteraceae bacterium]